MEKIPQETDKNQFRKESGLETAAVMRPPLGWKGRVVLLGRGPQTGPPIWEAGQPFRLVWVARGGGSEDSSKGLDKVLT